LKIELLSDESSKIVHEIVRLCYQRNFIFNCLYGESASKVFAALPASNVLREIGFSSKGYKADDTNKLKLDGLTAEGIAGNLNSLIGKPSVMNLTQIMQVYRSMDQLKLKTAHGSSGQSNSLS
jgi:hypothetical protein